MIVLVRRRIHSVHPSHRNINSFLDAHNLVLTTTSIRVISNDTRLMTTIVLPSSACGRLSSVVELICIR